MFSILKLQAVRLGKNYIAQMDLRIVNYSAINISEVRIVLYTVKEVAGIIKTNPSYVYKLINCGKLPAIKLGAYKVRREALEEFLKTYEGMDVTNPENIRPLK